MTKTVERTGSMAKLTDDIRERAEKWASEPFDETTREEVQALLDEGNDEEIYERFYKDLEFGTGGLRGLMGAGLNRMNRYTVARATQGLANYILKAVDDETPVSVAIAYDSRNNSKEFAKEAACVLAGNKIKVFLFDDLRPTPELSFAVRLFGATSGIVITASHNPKEYNGYKVYWNDGGQIVPPHDTGIIEEVKQVNDFEKIPRLDYGKALESKFIEIIGRKVDNAFCEAILPLSIHPEVCHEYGKRLKIVYTPLHGTGITLVPEALGRWGFQKVTICEEQRQPDGDFPTTESPNPEERSALSMAIDSAKTIKANLVLATDPDADRVGIAVRNHEEYVLLSGNQIASMLVEYVLEAHYRRGSLLPEAAVIKTIVTTELIRSITDEYNVHLDETLTGFKYIGEKIKEYQESGKVYMAGGEESYGYLVGTHARDKDAVVSCCFIAEMAADSLAKGETLVDRINNIYKKYGIFHESLLTIKLEGASGQKKIQEKIRKLREEPPKSIGGSKVVEIRDYKSREIKDAVSGKVQGQTDLPESNVLLFKTEDKSQVVVRPSGTEPKIKYYFSVRDTSNLPIQSDAELEERKKALIEKHDMLRAEFE